MDQESTPEVDKEESPEKESSVFEKTLEEHKNKLNEVIKHLNHRFGSNLEEIK